MSTEECENMSVNTVTSQIPFKNIHLQDTDMIAGEVLHSSLLPEPREHLVKCLLGTGDECGLGMSV